MTIGPGISGLNMDEPLLWEKGKKGRNGMSIPTSDVPKAAISKSFCREDLDFPDLSELDVVRHYTRLSQWNFGIDSGMYPLGSCTMKYNPKVNEKHAAAEEVGLAHPMLEERYCQGTLRILYELQCYLAKITGFDATAVQPAAGAHGELAGMLIFNSYHRSKNEKRTKILMPDTAHGTNPASAALCGYKPIPIPSGDMGILDIDLIREKMDEETAGIMITNPNTLGLFEENIRGISNIIHSKGGLVYGDGANMNAIMGIADLKKSGIDVLHLNLHKTFSTPHGGGGPGAGPVCVIKELERFLPAPRVEYDGTTYRLQNDSPHSIGRLHGFHGNFGVLVKALCYILSMGGENLKKVSQNAVLNANYIRVQLKDHLHLPHDQFCMHEVVFSDANLKQFKITTIDLAKRLMDFGYHPPTIYFPLVVPGAIMIEPTESECLEDIDMFISVVKEIINEAKSNPDKLRSAPTRFKVRRLDETKAARQPCLCG